MSILAFEPWGPPLPISISNAHDHCDGERQQQESQRDQQIQYVQLIASLRTGRTSALSLRPAAPNPFNPVTTIEYVLPEGAEASRTSLRIYDVQGRLVQDLVSARQAAGRHAATWYGRDDRGLAMPSGVYFHRLEWNGQQRVGRMVLVR